MVHPNLFGVCRMFTGGAEICWVSSCRGCPASPRPQTRRRPNGHTGVMSEALRVTCRRCGDLDVPIEQSRLSVGFGGPEVGAVVQFACPRCGAAGTEPVNDRAVSLLMAAGISVVAPPARQHSVGDTPSPG